MKSAVKQPVSRTGASQSQSVPRRRRPVLVVLASVAAVAAVLSLTACSRPARWCERDGGDVIVDDSYCRRGEPGYEWEPDTEDSRRTKPVTVERSVTATPAPARSASTVPNPRPGPTPTRTR
ncbi:hypothetical protein ACIGO9_29775 [Nocardia asteroides]|uniref:hypothetical protein n=1 Tax=Nocardia asteroides TaxID=1824 RepID=UPI0037C5D284